MTFDISGAWISVGKRVTMSPYIGEETAPEIPGKIASTRKKISPSTSEAMLKIPL